MNEQNQGIIQSQFNELLSKYHGLKLIRQADGHTYIKGSLEFAGTYNATTIQDTFEIEIEVPPEYPAVPPMVRETGERIPRDYHMYKDGTLCLTVPAELRRRFAQSPSLLCFVEDFVVHYLYRFSYIEKYQEEPYPDYSHGPMGLTQYFSEYFKIEDRVALIGMLRIIVEDNYRGHATCPCGSTKKLRDCHGPQIIALKPFLTYRECFEAYYYLFEILLKEKTIIPKEYFTKAINSYIKQHRAQYLTQPGRTAQMISKMKNMST